MSAKFLVVPDDAPSVLGPSQAWAASEFRDAATYYDSLPGSEDALIDRIAGHEVVVNIRSSTRFTRRVLDANPQLRLISIWGTGTDHVDLAAAEERGVAVANTPGVAAKSIAEHAIALLFAVARKIPQLDARVRAGEWPRGQMTQLAGKKIGIIGLGAIGLRTAEIAQALGMEVTVWTWTPRAVPFPQGGLDDVLAGSDVVSLHLRLSSEARAFLSRERIARMKRGALLINTARGGLVDESALVEALETGQLAGAGLDVFDAEPLPEGHPLTRLTNTVLSPHCAGITPEVLEEGLAMTLANVAAHLAGEPAHRVV